MGLLATTTNTLVLGANAVNFTITLTNQTGFTLTNVFITNTFSADINVLSLTNTYDVTNTSPFFQPTNFFDGTGYVFFLDTVSNAHTATINLIISVPIPGIVTNTITATAGNVTNVVTNLVFQSAASLSDLAVYIVPPIQAVVTNDLTTYDVLVTNFGPNDTAGILLTDTIPAGVTVRNASQSFTVVRNQLIFNLGTLTVSSGVDVQLLIQPTNVATVTFAASVGAPDLVDPNLTNDVASTNINIIGPLPGTFVAVTNSSQVINQHNGLIEQAVRLMNVGVTDAPAVRVVVAGLTNQLFNAVGTNGNKPFVYLSAPLKVGQGVTMILQYNPRSPFRFTNSELSAYAVPPLVWTPPKFTGASNNVNFDFIGKLKNNDILIEFPTISNKTYTVVYASDATFSNAQIAPPAIVAPGSAVQWIDYGPPATVSAPSNTVSRVFRVYQNP